MAMASRGRRARARSSGCATASSSSTSAGCRTPSAAATCSRPTSPSRRTSTTSRPGSPSGRGSWTASGRGYRSSRREGDTLGDLIVAGGRGRAVEYGDVSGWVEALEPLLDDATSARARRRAGRPSAGIRVGRRRRAPAAARRSGGTRTRHAEPVTPPVEYLWLRLRIGSPATGSAGPARTARRGAARPAARSGTRGSGSLGRHGDARPQSHRRAARDDRLRHNLRILRVLAAMDFKLKYSGSALGYVWSVIKPLSLFTILYLVFARIFRLGEHLAVLPARALIGVVLFTFFSEATTLGMSSIVARDKPDPKAIVSASDHPDVAHARRRDHIRRQPDRRRRLHRLERDPAALELDPARAAPARVLRLHPRRDAHPRDALRPPSGHRPGLGARGAADLLRDADHLPGRLPAGGARTIAFLNPAHAGPAGLPGDRPVPGPRAEPDHRDGCFRLFAGRLDSDRDRARRSSSSDSAFFRRQAPWFAERV